MLGIAKNLPAVVSLETFGTFQNELSPLIPLPNTEEKHLW